MKLCSPEGRALPRQGVATVARPQSLAGLRIGLLDARRRRRDVEIDGLRLFHQLRQLARAEAAPPRFTRLP